MPCVSDELYMSLVVSTKAHAEILSVDTATALQSPGVVDYIDHTDVQGTNVSGHIAQDEEIFASKEVLSPVVSFTEHFLNALSYWSQG